MNAPAVESTGRATGVDGTWLEVPLNPSAISPEDSQQCVLQMITDLRRYHHQRNLSHQERFGEPDPVSESALEEIAQALGNAERLIRQAEGRGDSVVLTPSIQLRVVPQQA